MTVLLQMGQFTCLIVMSLMMAKEVIRFYSW